MRITAYVCDLCGAIKRDEEVSGFEHKPDLFDTTKSLPITKTPEKAPYHFCLDCYHEHVIVPVSNHTNRAKDEKGYNTYLNLVSYNFKNLIVYRVKKGLKPGEK